MGHNGKDEIMVHEIEASAMVEIKIKTLDSQTYTLRVDKCVPVPALKEQIASVTGVVTEQQRLICRGKVLKDDQLLSAYHVEDGHTLHLVVRQPIPHLSESSTSNSAGDPALGAGESQGSQRSRVLVGSFNIAEQDGMFSDIGQLVSAVLGSLGISNPEGGIEGIEAMGPLHERLSRSNTARESSGGRNAVDQTSTPLTSSQPEVVPDSVETMSAYLIHLRQGFAANGSNANNLHNSENSTGNVQDSGSTTGETRILRPSHLAEVMQSTRQLLRGEASDYISNISTQLVDHVNVTDPSTRSLYQTNVRSAGYLLEELGTLLLELARAAAMFRYGQTPDDAIVNDGPAVFISPTGRNPLPSHSSRLGTNIGGLPAGTAPSSPFAGHSLASAPRNIEIRIRTGSWMPTSAANQREESTTQQTPGESTPSAPSNNNDAVPPSMRGPSESQRSPVALVIPVVTRYQQVISGGSTGLDGVHQPVADSSRQPQSTDTPGREGDSPGIRGLNEIRNRINQFLRPLSRREHAQAGSRESEATANPSATAASTETNEAVANAQVEPASGTDEGNFLSSVLHQIMPYISQNLPSSSSDEAAGRASNSSRQTSSREEEEGADRGDSSSRSREEPSPPDSKRQKRE